MDIAFYTETLKLTQDIADGKTSLGGSESTAFGHAKALARRGHDVTFFTPLAVPQTPLRSGGVTFVDPAMLGYTLRMRSFDAFISLRFPDVLHMRNDSRCRVFWSEDVLEPPGLPPNGLSLADLYVFVSQYHRKQWCDAAPWLRDASTVTFNSIDMPDVSGIVRKPKQVIYTSRPERGLQAIIDLWPRVKEAVPDATLKVCRYASHADQFGWQAVCDEYDEILARLPDAEMLGMLSKPDLYRAIAESAVMFYPAFWPYAETFCIAALEAQACRTPFIGGYRGAIPEVAPHSTLINGLWTDPGVPEQYLAALIEELQRPTPGVLLDSMQQHAHSFSHDNAARWWEETLETFFETRYQKHKDAVYLNLLHSDCVLAAHYMANAEGWVERVQELDVHLSGDTQTTRPMNTDVEVATGGGGRLSSVAATIAQAVSHVPEPLIYDVACGNGSFAILLAQTHPRAAVLAIDHDGPAIEQGRAAARARGLDTRILFKQHDWRDTDVGAATKADAVFCGEFIEHVRDPHVLIDTLERMCKPGGRVFFTTPCGPFRELADLRQWYWFNNHVHEYTLVDLRTMLRGKRDVQWTYLPSRDITARGAATGFWVVSWEATKLMSPAAPLTGLLPDRIKRTRPYQHLTACLILKNDAPFLSRTFESIGHIADRIVVVDYGVTGAARLFLDHCLTEYPRTVIYRETWPDDFAAARNRSVEAAEQLGTDWIFWVDADEELRQAELLRYMTESVSFHGFIVEQRHAVVDTASTTDRPVRLFRANRGVRFYGLVHEHPEEVVNKGIYPTLHQRGAWLLHFGYPHDTDRRAKLIRNFPLLKQEVLKGNATRATLMHYFRDLVQLAALSNKEHERRQLLGEALNIWDAEDFGDSSNLYHEAAWEYYQRALSMLPNATSVEFRGWTRNESDLWRHFYKQPFVIDVEPFKE